MFTRSLALGLATFLFATPALAASDIRVTLPTPSPAYVYDVTSFDITVANIGNKSASNVIVTIQLPATHTSPQVYVMGTLSPLDPRCTRSGTVLTCNLGTVARNTSTIIGVDIELPQAEEPLDITASATTTSLENSTLNNAATAEAQLLNYDVTVAVGDIATNRHCTGQGLTSFFECLLFPSSISFHDVEFLSGGEIAIPNEPDYGGSWSQPDGHTLEVTYVDLISNTVVAEFVGYGTNASCFEGITTFPGSAYISPYEVCL